MQPSASTRTLTYGLSVPLMMGIAILGWWIRILMEMEMTLKGEVWVTGQLLDVS